MRTEALRSTALVSDDVSSPPGYEVLRRIGRGGMGEVFHAVRLAAGGFRKDVALKRLTVDQAVDGKAVQRFLQEARVSARLEHRHLVRVHDLIEHGGVHYMAMELLRGKTLLELARWLHASGQQVPWPPLFDAAVQALDGLAYAHALADEHGRPLGLVHRDLTPRNVFVCEDGVVKVLDFGIVKLHQGASAYTTAGNVAGTFEFLSPEQARAGALDARSDLYQLGASLYFCLTGASPHGEGSPIELLNRALQGATRPLSELRPELPAPVVDVVMTALAQEPAGRYADAKAMQGALRDVLATAPAGRSLHVLVRDCLAADGASPPLSATPQGGPTPKGALALGPPTRPLAPVADVTLPPTLASPTRVSRRRAVTAAGAVLVAVGGYLGGRLAGGPTVPPPRWQRRTFRRGAVHEARFAPDSRGFLVSATWGDEAPNVWLSTPDSPEVRELGVPGQELLSIGKNGALALLDDAQPLYGFARRGTLTRTALAGGAPRAELEGVQAADFAPDGTLLVLRWVDDVARLEFPAGTLLAQTSSGWFSEPRVSPTGDRVAVLEHDGRYDDRGRLVVFDRSGERRWASGEFLTAKGVAWAPSGRSVWATASRDDNTRALWSLSAGREPTLLARTPATLTILDVDTRGRALVARETSDLTVTFARDGVGQRDLSWFDASFAMGLSDDATVALINEGGGDATAAEYGAYLRPTDGSPPVRLAAGHAAALSPDGKQALVIASTWDRLLLVPTGAGTSRELLQRGGLHAAAFAPDQRTVLAAFHEAGHQKLVRVPVEGGVPITIDAKGLEWRAPSSPMSNDGSLVLIDPGADELRLMDARGEVRPLPGAKAGDSMLRFSGDGASVFVARHDELPCPVIRLTLATGARERLFSLAPPDLTGVARVFPIVLSPDGRAAAFGWRRALSVLYLVEGLPTE